MMRAVLLLGAALAALACNDPREAELVQELGALEESRVAKSSHDRMRAEVQAGEAALAELETRLGALRPQLEAAEGGLAEVQRAIQREIDRNGALNREIREGQERLQQAAGRQAALEQQVVVARARARTFKDQAAALAKELRPDDPDWARRLRIRSLEEFLREVAQAWPRDPVLAEAAGRALPADPAEATRLGAELAARIRDRVAEVYGLGEGSTAAEAPAVAAGGGAS